MIVGIYLLNGLALGMLLALIATGLALIFGFMKIVNFSHGAIYMLGAYISFAFLSVVNNFWLALIFSPLLVGGIGLLIERFLLRKIASADPIYSVLFTFGLALMIENLVRMLWGSSNHAVQPPAFLQESVNFFGYPYPAYRLFVIIFSALICLLLYLVLYRTHIGIRVRAGTADTDMAAALGINVSTLGMVVFGFGCSLAAAAGVVAGPFLTLSPDMGATIIIDVFIIVVIGGMGNFLGALLGAVLIGFIESFGSIFLPQFSMVFVYLVMIIVLVINADGLMTMFKRANHS